MTSAPGQGAAHPRLALDLVDSTNATAWKALEEGAAPGLVVTARGQTAGRGREGRTFHSPPGGGLWASILLGSSLPPARLPAYAVAAAVAAAEAFSEASGLKAGLRWPNDLMVGERKTGGILAESRPRERGAILVLGIGINLSLREEELPRELRGLVTSAAIAGGRIPSPDELLASLLPRLDGYAAEIEAGCRKRLLERWKALCGTLGRRVAVEEGGNTVTGILKDLTLERIEVETGPGTLRAFAAGHVTRLVELS